MKQKLVMILIVGSFATAGAAENIDCNQKTIEIKAAGFSGFGAEAKKLKAVGRLAKSNLAESAYERTFEIGRYRFERANEKWSVYRKNDQGIFEPRPDIAFPVKVSVDQPLYVSQRDINVLELRRNTDDVNSTSMTIVFSPEKIEVKNSAGKPVLTYRACSTAEKSAPFKAPAVNTGT